jgi:hypothetical protein
MIAPEVLDALLKAGATAEMIVAAVKADAEREAIKAARQVPWLQLREMAFARDGRCCGYCGDEGGPFEVDHIIPRIKGGENVLDNVLVACQSCNRAKRDRQGDDWDTLQERRARDRDRKRAERARVRGLSEDVQGQGVPSVETPSPQSPPLKSTPDPEKITPPLTPHPQPSAARKADPFPRPEWADPQVWLDLLANRRKKNLANTASAHRKLLADIERLVDDHWPPGRILEAAVSRGWGAIYAGCKDDDDRSQANRGSNGRMVGPRPDPTLELVRAAAAAQREDRRDYGEARPALPAR